MYIIAAAVIELLLIIKVIHVYILCAFAFFYVWSYLDGKEYTGERHWPLFRNLVVWKWLSPVEYVLPSDVKGKRLYFMIPCATPIPLIWGIGLHGGELKFHYPIHYIVPPLYLWLPVVRDVLMWTGAVTYSRHNSIYALNTVILDLLDRGRSVCYCPSNYFSAAEDDMESQIQSRYPSTELLTLCRSASIQVCPIVLQNELLRYRVINHRWLHMIQSWTYSKLDYPLPLVYWMRLRNANKPPALLVQFGAYVSSNLYNTTNELEQELRKKVSAVSVPILQDSKETKGN